MLLTFSAIGILLQQGTCAVNQTAKDSTYPWRKSPSKGGALGARQAEARSVSRNGKSRPSLSPAEQEINSVFHAQLRTTESYALPRCLSNLFFLLFTGQRVAVYAVNIAKKKSADSRQLLAEHYI
jgi:hypothetical protein